MSVQHPSRTAGRLIQLASLSLAALLAGLCTGCTSAGAAVDLGSHNDTGWQTPETYASATADVATSRTSRAFMHLRNTGASHPTSTPSSRRHAMPSSPSL